MQPGARRKVLIAALFLEIFDGTRPCRGGDRSLRGRRLAAPLSPDRQLPRFHALGRTTGLHSTRCRTWRRLDRFGRSGRAPAGRRRRQCNLGFRWFALFGTSGGVFGRGAGLACPQGRWPPLLDRPRVTAHGAEIRGHGSGFTRPGGIMFPKKSCAGLLKFSRTAVASVAGGGKNLRRGLAGIEVGLGVNRESCS